MPEEPVSQDVKTESANAEGVNELAVTGDDKTESSVPYARFKQVNDKLKEVNDRLTSMDSERKEEGEKLLAKEGKKDELIANLKIERDSLKTNVDEMGDKISAIEDARRDELISRMPETLREKYANREKYSLDVLTDIVEDLGDNRATVIVDNSRPSARETHGMTYDEFSKQPRKDKAKNWTQFLKGQS